MSEYTMDELLPAEPDSRPETPAEQPATVKVVDIQFRTGSKVYFFDPGALELKQGDEVIIETARGPEFGTCASGVHDVSRSEIVPPLRSVLRLATAADQRTMAENRAKEKKAYEICQQKIAEQGLDMQLVSAEYAFDGSKILFFFTADDRVDFRELVRNLASVFRTRIELRQIGVRDKAKMVGGLGICGRPFCCSQFLDDFQPVSIKMAKTQNLSLNPTKISGTCGRLLCCLKYEQEAYEDLLRKSPKAESFVDTPDGRGTVTEVNLLRQSVKVRMEEHPEEIGCYQNSEICVLRNGKAKKTDPPIPADLAPISGGGKRVKKPEPEEAPMTLEPIRFRYRSDEIVPETPEEPAWAPEEAAPERRPRRRRKKPAAPAAEGHPLPKEPREENGPAARPGAEGRRGGSRKHKNRRPEGEKPSHKEGQSQSGQAKEGQARPESGGQPGKDGQNRSGGSREGQNHRRRSRRPKNRTDRPGGGNSGAAPQGPEG